MCLHSEKAGFHVRYPNIGNNDAVGMKEELFYLPS